MTGIGTPNSQSRIPRPKPIVFTIVFRLVHILWELADGSVHTDPCIFRVNLLYTTNAKRGWRRPRPLQRAEALPPAALRVKAYGMAQTPGLRLRFRSKDAAAPAAAPSVALLALRCPL